MTIPCNESSDLPLVSVVIAAYNCADYIENAMLSILGQTYKNLEVIIVDDGSSDATPEILSKFQGNNIYFYRRAHTGLASSLNYGVKISNGVYIARQDADDMSLPNRIAQQVSFLSTSNGYGLVGSQAVLVDSRNNQIGHTNHPTMDQEIRSLIKERNCFTHGTVMFTRDVFSAVGGYNEEFVLAQDYELWLRMIQHTMAYNIPEFHYHYTQRHGSLSNRFPSLQQDFMAKARKNVEGNNC